MRAFEIQNKFGLDSLIQVERPDPAAKPFHAVIQLRAASLNYRDLLTVEGKYNPRLPLPLIPLSDGVGEVVAIGESVTRVKPGDRVAANFSQKWLGGEPTRPKLGASLGGPLDIPRDGLPHPSPRRFGNKSDDRIRRRACVDRIAAYDQATVHLAHSCSRLGI